MYHARTKHMDRKCHYVREVIESGVVLFKKIDIKNNPVNMLTKVIYRVKFSTLLKTNSNPSNMLSLGNF